MRNRGFGLIWILVAILSGALFPSCRSHKKIQKDEIFIEETVEIKHNKHNKKGQTLGDRIAEESMTWIGTPYGFGKSEKGVATDCSGMVIVIYEQLAEIKLPRNSAEQADFCEDLEEKEIEPGDLVFFATGKDKKKVSHVGIMIDREKFVHASGSKGVMLSEMTTPYYRRTFIKYGRVPGRL
ncbi:MAG: C40 family peptidase [Muribaculaceae bacterium]|nr:C40 family peptidase [Muribaculaceae bacterium]